MDAIERLLADFQERPLPMVSPRRAALSDASGMATVVIGMRRSGKTYLLYQEMHRLIAEEAGHSAIAEMLRFVDYSDEPELERLQAERRAEARRSQS